MKYIVFWLLAIQVILPNQPNVDEFGKEGNWVTLELNYKTDYEQYYKEFDNREEAIAFFERGQKRSDVYAIAMDSVYIVAPFSTWTDSMACHSDMRNYIILDTLPLWHYPDLKYFNDTIILER